MNKNVIETLYQQELGKLNYYHRKFNRFEKDVRDYEHFRQKYLHHKKLADYYSSVLTKTQS